MFEKILIAVDLNDPEQADKAVAAAKELHKDKTAYLLVTVIPPLAGGSMIASFLPKNYDTIVLEELLQALETYAAKQFSAGENVACRVVRGSVYEEVNRIAAESACDSIVLCAAKSRAHGLGPNAARVVRYSGKSVFVVRR